MDPEKKRTAALAMTLILIVGAIVVLERPWDRGSQVPSTPGDLPAHLASLRGAPDFGGATGWLNTADGSPIDLQSLRGQVVLVDFWTYSCINCIRTFPYVRAWHEAYADDGLVIVGVHSPEFRFERDPENVQAAADRNNLTHPIALDNDFDIWKAYQNRFWPAKYLIGPYGKIRYTHFGEGAYDETEQKIRDVLTEAGRPPNNPPVEVVGSGSASSAGRTPELFAGAAQGESRVGIGNPEGYHRGERVEYAMPADVPRDKIFLSGAWYNDDDHVRADSDDARIFVRFQAGGANFVADADGSPCVEIFLDDVPIPADRAARSVTTRPDGSTCVEIGAPDSYEFYGGPFEEHLVEIRVPPGFALFSFAFSSTPTK